MSQPATEQSGVDLIAQARAKHETKGWTAEHDDGHSAGELAMAAACYAAPERIYVERHGTDHISLIDPWPFRFQPTRSGRGGTDWDKRKHGGANFVQAPETQDRLELLIAAGALIAAEIDRLKRASTDSGQA
jgi:hypothetical protein